MSSPGRPRPHDVQGSLAGTSGSQAGAKAKSLQGAASRSYSVASAWEQSAVLSSSQERVVDLVAEHCSQRPLPQHVLAEVASTSQSSTADRHGRPDAEELLGSLEEIILHSSNQFYKWHSELEAARTSETEEKYRQYAGTLSGHLQTCEALLAKVDETLGFFEQLKTLHREVSSKTRALHDSCERLVLEKERLVEFADALRSKLAYFDELERVSAQFHSASLAVESDHFLPLLKRLDECITYVTSNPQYADSSAYAGKFRQLQSRAMATMRTQVQQVLRHAAEQVQAAMRERRSSATGGGRPSENGATSNGHAAPMTEGAATALLYVRFRAAAEPGLKGLLQGMESRSQRPEYARLVADCQQAYCDTRLHLVSGVTRERIAEYAREPLPSLMRHGCSYLMQVCQLEHQLFDHFFPGEDPEGTPLAPLMDPLCTILYDTLRPAFIQLQDLDDLCELVDILEHEVLEEALGRRGEAVAPLRPVLLRTLADIQERLTFRTHAFIKEEVVGYQPKPADLDYPAKLQQLEQQRADEAEAAAQNGQAVWTEDAERESAMDTYSAWYPPVQQTLLCLSKLYRCVDPRVFGSLAQEAVSSCAASVQAASRQVAKRSSLMDGQLFMIKQLLILREQIAPFEAEFAITEKDLDFTHMRAHLRRIMAGQVSLFTLSSENAMVQVFSKGPRVLENQVDSKKELEKQLKVTCESFIMGVTKLTVEPMLSFITKVTAVKVAYAGKPLREQAFAAPPRLAEMVQKVKQALQTALPAAVNKMKLYLNNPSTHAILFKPIKSNIAEAHGQIAALLESEYTAEEAAAIQLTLPQELAALLDSLC
ncbi:hypothetical protein WJX72_012420 [[Myrmecia] bisecta]|uniref:Conserved oligomeric Golgi complex subunit 3 n=1 Tax=[Myrmecia] bisecta TaxID=41462 RepID=A0AAW1Q8J9_9CHLO